MSLHDHDCYNNHNYTIEGATKENRIAVKYLISYCSNTVTVRSNDSNIMANDTTAEV